MPDGKKIERHLCVRSCLFGKNVYFHNRRRVFVCLSLGLCLCVVCSCREPASGAWMQRKPPGSVAHRHLCGTDIGHAKNRRRRWYRYTTIIMKFPRSNRKCFWWEIPPKKYIYIHSHIHTIQPPEGKNSKTQRAGEEFRSIFPAVLQLRVQHCRIHYSIWLGAVSSQQRLLDSGVSTMAHRTHTHTITYIHSFTRITHIHIRTVDGRERASY